MNLVTIGIRNAWRSPVRTFMTIGAVALSLTAFVLLRTLAAAWDEQVEQTPADRVITRNRMGWDHYLPAHYANAIRQIGGVKDVVTVRWAGLRFPRAEGSSFESHGVDEKSFIAIHDELEAPQAQKQAFVSDRRGAFVSRELADEFGWKLNDHVQFTSRQFRNTLELNISGIFRSKRQGFASRVIYMNLGYLNEVVPVARRDLASFIAVQISAPDQGARIAREIDSRFDDSEVRTFTMEDKALNAMLTGRFAAVLEAMNVVSLLVLAIVLMVLGNAVAMSVRERTQEYATLAALGFRPRQIGLLVIGEAAALGFGGGLIALPIAYPLIERGVSKFLRDAMALPPLSIRVSDALVTVAFGTVLGAIAAYLSIRRVMRQEVVALLRHAG